ncbi:MAG TPA: class I SAM-dependent methyltransferase [Candidatus Acidoferrales bacterium]|nr:class I SAM-dependent methyltransferase [Candidatus Acidoferrales bacterium]
MSLTGEPDANCCPVCRGAPGRTIYADARDPITLETFRVVECSACSVVYTAPRPPVMDRFYPRQYRAYGRVVTRVLSMLYNLRTARWAGLKPEGGNVLEVGCGPGLMLAAFHRRGWKVLGIERNEAVAGAARQALGLEIVTTPVEQLPVDSRFDLIVMFQVFEHLGDPMPVLRECARRLAPGGRLLINVPNFASWQSRFAGDRWLHLDVPRHLNHFTPETLAATLERAGLQLADLGFVSLEHDPYGWVESTISMVVGRTNTLTRFLEGLDPFGPRVAFSFALGALLAAPATLLAGASWLARSGALMEATAVRSAAAEE